MRLSPAMEDYLKVIGQMEQEGRRVTTQALAQRLKVKPPSVTGMLKKLTRLHLIRYSPYGSVELTEAGRKAALEVLRHHRLIELYLREALGLPLHRLDEEADRLEHALSEELEDAIAAALGHPTRDPHGHPIPTKDGQIEQPDDFHLTDAEHGVGFVIVRVSDRDGELLKYLESLGLVPEAVVTVVRRDPFGGPLWVQVADKTHPLGLEAAQHIFVRHLSDLEDRKESGVTASSAAPKRVRRKVASLPSADLPDPL
ncbi:MAG: metal-dependent transcriptional regulator [Armatimonadetes bacterium]|nr:metal-dependent transcriptional regulator [Armatimonadota bacterium]MDW8121488.1 metal-dependent transcriptional regulator [Armatimonadota bacterium]